MVWIIAMVAGCGSGSATDPPADPGPASLGSDDVAEAYTRAIASGPRAVHAVGELQARASTSARPAGRRSGGAAPATGASAASTTTTITALIS